MRFLRNAGPSARGLAAAAKALIVDDNGRGAGPNDDEDDDFDPAAKAEATAPADEPKPDAPAEPPAPAPEPPAPAPAPEAARDQIVTARAEERARVAAVFASDAVKGREQAAAMLLTETDMSAETIIAKLPTLAATASGDAMLNRLASSAASAPTVGAGAEPSDAKADTGKVWDNALAKLDPVPAK